MSRFLSIAAVLCGFALSAHAQATRTWVSGVGDDANPCSRTAPCKTFAGAISKTAAGGEISVLDPGGFGVVTITKSITINGTGTLAGILSAGSPAGVIVNAGVNDTVILRDLSLNGAGTGTNGIRYLAAKTVVVDHCSIYGMTSRGIDAALNATGNLKVCNSIIENVLEDGIHMNTGAGFLTAMLDGSQIMNCGGDAIEAVNNVRGEVIHSRLLAAGASGVTTTGGNSQVNIVDSLIAHCSTGLSVNASSPIRVSDTVIANNSVALASGGASIDSFQGNSLIGNSLNGAFTTTTPKQ